MEDGADPEVEVDVRRLRHRWWLMWSVLTVGWLFIGGATFLWYGNTASIHELHTTERLHARPGEVVRFRYVDECSASILLLYRQGLMGRWQRTHIGNERHVVPWYQLEDHTLLADDMMCRSGGAVRIPVDVTWSPVAACDIDNDCVVIDVDGV